MALSHLIDLASERIGGAVMAANDEFFAGRENLVRAAAPVERDEYVLTGKWMDGWETRRRREQGHDWCIVRLGLRGAIRSLVVDTSFFRGNYPESCLVEACDARGAQPDLAELERAAWFELLPRSPLQGDHRNVFPVAGDRPVTHLRLRIYPDGGVARLRALGAVLPDWDRTDFTGELVDLVASASGGRVLECSDMFFGDAQNMLMPGTAFNMSDGWETRRRRGPGNDWAIVELGAVGRAMRVELDTTHFKGNSPGQFSLDGCLAPGASADALRSDAPWWPILPRTRLLPHTRHSFQDELALAGPLSHVRLQIYPDGGVARLRLWGRTERSHALLVSLARKSALSAAELAGELARACASPRWSTLVADGAPYPDLASLMVAADRVWRKLEPDDWRAAFAAHPRIGDRGGSAWSQREQAGAAGASPAALTALVDGNRAYEARFGHVFLVCATGRTADEMLADLERRIANDPATELHVAAEEQRRITRLRLVKWLTGE
ncbi:MAG TPA: allantoicase [Kofleriaceae bacterium]|nr:allantoicase [Kofleriaceae bacterium]